MPPLVRSVAPLGVTSDQDTAAAAGAANFRTQQETRAPMKIFIEVDCDEPVLIAVIPVPSPSRPGPRSVRIPQAAEIGSPSSARFKVAPVIALPLLKSA